MGFHAKKPTLTNREIADQIFKRSGIPLEMIKTVMSLYAEITEEALLGNVEVPFGRIGYFGWRQIMPKEEVVTWNPKKLQYNKPQNTPGFQKTVFRVGSAWAKVLKEASRFELGEENPMKFGTAETAVYEEDEGMENNELGEDENGE